MRVVSAAFALAVSLVLVGSLFAAEEKKETKPPREDKARAEFVPGMEILRGVELTDAQKTKVAEIKKEYVPKFKALREKRMAIPTADQKTARKEAAAAAKEAGKSHDEIEAAGREAMKLTNEQKVKFDEVAKQFAQLTKEVREKVESVLTPDQKQVIKTRRAHRRGHRLEGT
ncbi:MAG: hypothetical protein LLG00_06835 [Planctomycetaceae bacterium]|nr:hypothetical protein [Planctomycetaceae bacterium]